VITLTYMPRCLHAAPESSLPFATVPHSLSHAVVGHSRGCGLGGVTPALPSTNATQQTRATDTGRRTPDMKEENSLQNVSDNNCAQDTGAAEEAAANTFSDLEDDDGAFGPGGGGDADGAVAAADEDR
jgi:hypothetical protein